MSFYPELDNLNLEELANRFQLPPPAGESEALYYQEIADIIANTGKAGIDFLFSKINDANTVRLQAIIFALTGAKLENSQLKSLLINYLHNQNPSIVMEAIEGLIRLEAKETKNEILALREHSSQYVRSSVLRYISKLYPEEALPLLIEGLKDPDYVVRESAADELGELEAVEAIEYLQPLTEDAHPDVRQAAQTSIEILRGNFSYSIS
ncbi:MAG TPA: HEAT repeat domain-containing protein [Nostocaceae cyanobacterium]|nr:HEAT repeat domain-containing protein [Nostocaceae cyanobacterium]